MNTANGTTEVICINCHTIEVNCKTKIIEFQDGDRNCICQKCRASLSFAGETESQEEADGMLDVFAEVMEFNGCY